jgi:hypothetical protein
MLGLIAENPCFSRVAPISQLVLFVQLPALAFAMLRLRVRSPSAPLASPARKLVNMADIIAWRIAVNTLSR